MRNIKRKKNPKMVKYKMKRDSSKRLQAMP